MTPDYQTGYWVRRSRLVGRVLILVMTLGGLLALGWKMAEVSENRAMQATREHLAASLTALAAEQMAKRQVVDERWQQGNPFVLLRWQQDNYCGELGAGDEPRAGCWYWLPQQAWVLYRPRFAGQPDALKAWRVWAVPDAQAGTSALPGRGFALELAEVPGAELAARGF